MTEGYIALKYSEVKDFREKLHKEQNYICPICNDKIELKDTTLDHQHKLFKNQNLHEDGAGEIRGVLCFQCNAFEGQLLSKFKRQGLHKKNISQSDLLRNLADYLDRENLKVIHPSEVPKPKKIGKRLFNKIKKAYSLKYPKRKPLEYPKSGNLTKKLELLIEEFKI